MCFMLGHRVGCSCGDLLRNDWNADEALTIAREDEDFFWHIVDSEWLWLAELMS